MSSDEVPIVDWSQNEPFIFVSYARENRDFVYPEIERLKAEGYNIWCDKDEIRLGRSFTREIEEAIESCSCFLVFITQGAMESDYVRREIKKAVSSGKFFIPIYWEKVVLHPDIQSDIQGIQGLEFYESHRRSYELRLGNALSESVEPKPFLRKGNDGLTKIPDPPLSDSAHGMLARIVFFVLILLGVILLILAFVAVVTPFLGNQIPGDPLTNRVSGFLAGTVFLVIAIGSGAGAFAVYRTYLRRKDG